MTHTDFFLDRFAAVYPYSHCVWRIPEASAHASFGPFSAPLLDLGCGDGSYFKLMLERVGKPDGKIIGLDPQAWEIEKAKRIGIYDELHVGMSNAIPLPDASVGMVFSNSVVEHIADKEGTIREVARILKPGGTYLFSAPRKGFDARMRLRDLINWKFKHYWLQTADEWTRDLERAGLRVREVRTTLSPENAAEWNRYILPSFLQHIPMKRTGWFPFSSWSRDRLLRRRASLDEPVAMSGGGNLVIRAEKPAV